MSAPATARAVLAVALVAVSIAAAGCGEETLDGGKLEDEITEDAEREGLVLDAVECPSPEAEEDATFTCTVTVKGEPRELEIRQRNDEGNVEYDLTPLLESRAGSDAGGDEASVRATVDAVNRNPRALCDYATSEYRRRVAEQGGAATCARALARAGEKPDPLRDYSVAVSGDAATAVGAASKGERTVTLRRQDDGSWLIADIE